MATNKVPGLIYPSVQATPGGNPRDSAILAQQQQQQQQTALANAVGGKGFKNSKKRRYKMKYGGAASANNIVVPQFQMQYKPTGANGQDPNSIIISGSQISTQGSANSVYDKYASQNGGKKGGSNIISWGCYSGGYNKKHKKTKKNKKNKRKTKKNLK